ncbi:hypothetical protein EVAR_28288_1 [Eumeta japonica]|uniref:IQ domain-containing protein K n=1 Tax=Eumeta variegata TaxID=151549 RepID=A0A4C1V895_EUMVA|nr:hypothetical protein EVAR_28288_1 [Eumeta japonica]
MSGNETESTRKANPTISESSLNAFKLPETLPCSTIEFPALVGAKTSAKWQEILNEKEEKMQAIKNHEDKKKESIPKSPFQKTECDYMREKVFDHLVPALEDTLKKAIIWNALEHQKCFFNGIDHIVQVLWNNNPKHPWRKLLNMHVFNMPWTREELAMQTVLDYAGALEYTKVWALRHRARALGHTELSIHRIWDPFRRPNNSPRPYYPKSWLWPEDYAATIIQKTVRRYFVLCDEEVQEMREFWTKLRTEHDVPDMELNPILAKEFALQRRSTQI